MRPEEVEWFDFAERSFEQRRAEHPDFSASATMDALKAEFFADVRFDELNEMDSDLWRLFNDTKIPKPDIGENLRILVLSWLAVTFRNAHSSFLLARDGFRDTSVANARVALDHSIYLSLLASGDERERITDRMEALFLKYLKSFGDITQSSNPVMEEFLQMASDEFPNMDPGKKSWSDIVEQVCERLSTGDIVYSRYRILSNMMHPGFPSTEPFAYAVKFNPSPFFRWTPVVNPASMVSFMAVASCVWAAWSVDYIFSESYFGIQLDPIADRLHLHRLFENATDNHPAPTANEQSSRAQ
jgi:hypothetical protein